MSRHRRRRRASGRERSGSLAVRVRRWLTLPRIWAVVSLLAVLVLILSLIAPLLTQGF